MKKYILIALGVIAIIGFVLSYDRVLVVENSLAATLPMREQVLVMVKDAGLDEKLANL